MHCCVVGTTCSEVLSIRGILYGGVLYREVLSIQGILYGGVLYGLVPLCVYARCSSSVWSSKVQKPRKFHPAKI